MFACPSRRAFLSCASHAPPTSRRLISTAAANSLRSSPQQAARRYSSSSSSSNSKPFGPNNRGLASKTGAFRKRDRQCQNEQNTQTVAPPIPGSKVPEVDVASADTAAIAEEVQKDEQLRNSPLPFVARTDHLRAQDVHASVFFALHRPVSVSFPVPGIYSSASFHKLFEESTPLSAMELHQIQMDVQSRQRSASGVETSGANTILSPDEVRALSRAGSANQAEQRTQGSSTDPQVRMNPILYNQYVPFRPPPPPEPIPEEILEGERVPYQQPRNPADEMPHGYILPYIPLDAGLLPGGRKRVSMRSRQPTMQALSVKRQRKLKMKKHKYKKLMKKTRTLRRKLEKQ